MIACTRAIHSSGLTSIYQAGNQGIGVYMPQLQVPLSIWLSSTPDERDDFYLAAGFDPSLPVVDSGTDTQFVRFRQDDLAIVAEDVQVAVMSGAQAGDDLRDFQPVSLTSAMPDTFMNGHAPVPTGGTEVAGSALSLAGRALRLVMGGGGGRLTAAAWNSLPTIFRTALTQIGIGVGALIAFNGDIPFITLPGQGADPSSEGGLPMPSGGVDIQIPPMSPSPLQSVQVVGKPWVANGVTFYRLADGRLAVQNKKGRWKVWRPKKPIVLYADGASSLKTMLRADKALNKQAKKIAAMLNRRAPRRKSRSDSSSTPIILGNNARVVDV